MLIDEFSKTTLTYLQDAVKAAAELMDAEPGTFRVETAPVKPVSYSRTVWFREGKIQIGLHKDVKPSLLLNMFIDAVADRIEPGSPLTSFTAVPLAPSPPPSLASISSKLRILSVDGPCSPRQWGEDVYRDVQNRLATSLGSGAYLHLDLFETLSAYPYEGAKCHGELAFESNEETDISSFLSMPIKAAREIPFEKDYLRQIRKLLAGAGDHILVFQRKGKQYLCRGYCGKEASARFQWQVRFTDVLDWEFCHHGRPMFRFFRKDPKIIRDPITTVLKDLKLEFGPDYDWDAARSLLASGARQQHGTALIFMDFDDGWIKKWTARLYCCERMIQLDESADGPDAVQSLSGMDGAILIDVHTMKVRYFTAVLDGHVFVRGDLSRGARHNGVLTFIADLARTSPGHSSKLASVVFSEDGGMVTICGNKLLT